MVSYSRLSSICRPSSRSSHHYYSAAALSLTGLLFSFTSTATTTALQSSSLLLYQNSRIASCSPFSSSSPAAATKNTFFSHTSSSDCVRTAMSEFHVDGDNNGIETGYLNAEDAYALDQELMSTPGFSLEQLMELAGLAVAEAVYLSVPLSTFIERKPKILLVCGPGNNGGDGLVAARHLVMFGYDCTVLYPKPSKKEHFVNLVHQCHDVGVEVLEHMPEILMSCDEDVEDGYDAVVDAIFGFSFKGEPREPFASILKDIISAQQQQQQQHAQNMIVISVDVPSGWNVNDGDVTGMGFMPDVLISLTAPKLSSKGFHGRHFVGGRFLPPKLAYKYNIRMPPYTGMSPYPGVSQVMELPSPNNKSPAAATTDDVAKNSKPIGTGGAIMNKGTSPLVAAKKEEDWETQYAEYLAEKEQTQQPPKTSSSMTTGKPKDNINEAAKGTKDDDWAVEYYKYLEEKEANQRREKKEEAKKNGNTNNHEEKDMDDWAVEYAKHLAETEKDL